MIGIAGLALFGLIATILGLRAAKKERRARQDDEILHKFDQESLRAKIQQLEDENAVLYNDLAAACAVISKSKVLSELELAQRLTGTST